MISTIRPDRRARLSAGHEPARMWSAFLEIGPGAEQWLIKAAAAGAHRVRRKTIEAVDLAKLHGAEQVNRALGVCAQADRSRTVISRSCSLISSAPGS
jgi:DNA-binding IclR family transcriptional regulator